MTRVVLPVLALAGVYLLAAAVEAHAFAGAVAPFARLLAMLSGGAS